MGKKGAPTPKRSQGSTRWKPGELVPGAKPFPPGVSGNPGGQPKGYRAKCRADADKLRALVLAKAEAGAAPLGELVRAFEAVSDRGGFVTADKSGRMLLDSLAVEGLTPEQRRQIVEEWRRDEESEP